MHCSSSEALAQLVRLGGRVSLSLSLTLGLCGNPFPTKNGAIQRSPTVLEVGVGAGDGIMEGTLLSIQVLPQREKGTPVLGLSLGLGRVTRWSHGPDS